MRFTRLTGMFLLTILVLTACGGSGSKRPAAQAAPPPPSSPSTTIAVGDQVERVDFDEPEHEPTAWESIRAGVAPDGTVPKETALQAFALAFGPLPGVDVPRGEPGIHSGSTALRWIAPHLDDLTVAQRAAVDAVVTPVEKVGARTGAIEAVLLSARPAIFGDKEYSCTIQNAGVSEDGDDTGKFRSVVDGQLQKLESRFGYKLGIKVYLTTGVSTKAGSAQAWSSPQSPNCADSPATSCRVHLFVDVLAKYDARRSRSVVAHELVHCFQATYMAARSALQRPDWITEGFADFAGDELNPGATDTNLWTYIYHPSRALFERDYDAQGFFFHLYRSGGDVYERYKAAFRMSSSSEDAFMHLAGPSGKAFSDTWASALSLQPERGDAWNMPDAPADADVGWGSRALQNGMLLPIFAPTASTRVGHVTFLADIVRFTVKGAGHGRINWDGENDITLAQLGSVAYCNIPGGCTCPDDSKGSPPDVQVPSDGAQVSAVGMLEGTGLDIAGVALDEYCNPEPEATIDPCVVGEWLSTEWVLPGPVNELTAKGGADAHIEIRANGVAEWDFDLMDPMVMYDPDIDLTTTIHSRGIATGRISAGEGTWTVDETDLTGLTGSTSLSIGGEAPSEGVGAFVGILDGSYTCNGDLLSYSTVNPANGKTVNVLMHRL